MSRQRGNDVELVAVLIMLVVGVGVAAVTLTVTAIASRERPGEVRRPSAPPTRDSIAASILFHVLSAGGASRDEALREIRRGAGLAAPVTAAIDLGSWAESYARAAGAGQSRDLLEIAVRLAAGRSNPIPLRQYVALLDLSFGLGFQTDALAKLRSTYGFEYIDHAKEARPREADRGGGATPLFVRGKRERPELLAVLGVAEGATRQELGTAYRRLAAQHHPDRFHGASPAEEAAAAARFIEITRAYEELLALQDV